jgi:hypothetical protein
MAIAKKHHRILWIAGAGLGAWAAYRYVYQPWAAASAAAAAAGTQAPSLLSAITSAIPLPSPAAMVGQPLAITPSNLSPGLQVGGPVGACMQKKGNTWTQQQCQSRLDALTAAASNARLAISQLSVASNPAASGIPQAQAQIALEQAALNVATTNYNNAVAAGNSNDAATWNAAIIGHQNDINELNARIAAAQTPVDNSAAIAAYQGQLAANDNDYFALTGSHLISGI